MTKLSCFFCFREATSVKVIRGQSKWVCSGHAHDDDANRT
jgi:hypothetical protein